MKLTRAFQIGVLVLTLMFGFTHPAYAAKAVAFFETEACPAGWHIASEAQGRMILGVNQGAFNGNQVGTPLGNQEDRTHVHGLSAGTVLPPKSISAANGPNRQGAGRGTYAATGRVDPSTSNMPFIQMTVCEQDQGGEVEEQLPIFSNLYFNEEECPTGWMPYNMGEGRFVVPLVTGGQPGGMVGRQLDNQEQRTHQHSITSEIDVPGVDYVGIAGCCNGNLAREGSRTVAGQAVDASLGLPYVQLLSCLKTSPQRPGPIPDGLTAFFPLAEDCPLTWDETTEARGRFMVGLPEQGTAMATFGGEPLTSQERRDHTHPFSGSITTSPHGIALASGCCAKDYAKNGTFDFSGTSGDANYFSVIGDDSDVANDPQGFPLPYIQLLTCSKN